MTAPFDPDETHGNGHDEEMLDANSMTWGSVDPDFDELFRERLGPLPVMPTPPYAFERVLVAGRRRRARKVWAGAAAAVFVVMAGTAGTTVALNGASSPGGPTIGEAHSGPAASSLSASSSPSVSAPKPSPSKPAPTTAGGNTPTAAAGVPNASTSTSASPSTPWCQSSDFQLAVSAQPATSGAVADTLLIVLTNSSGHTCTTYGFPGLELETQSEQDQSTQVTREKTGSVQTLTVASGASISTTATYTAAAPGATSGAACYAPSYYLAVIPPNEKIQIAQPISGGPVTVCGGVGNLDTDAFVMGSSGD